MNPPFGAGGFLTTETREIDLGEHEGVRLSGHVEERILRLGIGSADGVRLQLTRARPTMIRVASPSGVTDHWLPANPDPWLAALQRTVLVAVATVVMPRFWHGSSMSRSVSRLVSHWRGASRLHQTRHGGAHGTD